MGEEFDGLWLTYDYESDAFYGWWIYEQRRGQHKSIHPSDILATDWEIEQ